MRRAPIGPAIPLATFYFDGASVTAIYESASYQREIEHEGLGLVIDGAYRKVRPSDGRVFYDDLAPVYSQSSLVLLHTSRLP